MSNQTISISISKLNYILSNFEQFRYSDENLIHKDTVKTCNGDYNDRGEEGEEIRVYDVIGDGWFLKVNVGTDSYGKKEFIRSVEIVQGRPKQITVYEFDPVPNDQEMSF